MPPEEHERKQEYKKRHAALVVKKLYAFVYIEDNAYIDAREKSR